MNEVAFHGQILDAQQGHPVIKAAWDWAKSMTAAGHKLGVTVEPLENIKTDRQRRFYHGVILKEISEQVEVNGQKFPLQVWKEHMRMTYLGSKTKTFINPITGKKSRRQVRISTEDLGIKAYNELIEKVTAYAVTELGVMFSADMEHYE